MRHAFAGIYCCYCASPFVSAARGRGGGRGITRVLLLLLAASTVLLLLLLLLLLPDQVRGRG